MQRLFAANEGLQRRVQRIFEFDDLTPTDIARVMRLQVAKAQQATGEDGGTSASSCSRSINSEDRGFAMAPVQGQAPLAGFR